jgi:hypothetical protein
MANTGKEKDVLQGKKSVNLYVSVSLIHIVSPLPNN